MSLPKSFDDLPDVVHSFAYCADLAAILIPEDPDSEQINDSDTQSLVALAIARLKSRTGGC